MLQMTFRNILPDESLLAFAHAVYANWRESYDVGADALQCHVTLQRRQAFHMTPDSFRVHVTVARGSMVNVQATAEERDPTIALRDGLLAASVALVPFRVEEPQAMYA